MFFVQTVVAYYGGREISDEDLERALLVGMSPHERKRFEKKRGFTFKHLARSIYQNHGKEIGGETAVSIPSTSKGENMDSNEMKANQDPDGADADAQPSSLGFGGNESGDVTSDMKVPITKCNSIANDEAASRSVNSLNKAMSLALVTDTSPKHEPKLSLLGHGPHGKQVVEHILKEYGEEGICDFCQRWRQVFVEALHPRFLPAGWDIMHRYSFK